MPIEKELKYHLDKKSYAKILSLSRDLNGKTVEQHNYYFDTKALTLRMDRVSLRVRLYPKLKKADLTLKSTITKLSIPRIGFKAQNEIEVPISYLLAKKLCKNGAAIMSLREKPIQVLREQFPESVTKRIRCLGCLKTTRTKFALEKSTAELDRSRFFGKVFYEMEVETTRPISVDKTVRKFLENLTIPYSPSNQSKIGRFLKGWTERNELSQRGTKL